MCILFKTSIFLRIGKKNKQPSVSDADREIPTLGLGFPCLHRKPIIDSICLSNSPNDDNWTDTPGQPKTSHIAGLLLLRPRFTHCWPCFVKTLYIFVIIWLEESCLIAKSYEVAVIQWITSCHKSRMTTRVITLWRVYLTSLTTSVSSMRFLLEILFISKAIKSLY